MAQTVRDVMTEKPVALQAGTTLVEAASAMRDHDVGSVLVLQDDAVRGIVTDRDIVVRAVADGRDPGRTVLAEISSEELVSISPQEPIDRAVTLMREHAVRRLHQRPDSAQVAACRPWLEAEVRTVRPRLLICLGATAVLAVLGSSVRVLRDRGRFLPSPLGVTAMATVHPSSILRAPGPAAREEAYAGFGADLRRAASWIGTA